MKKKLLLAVLPLLALVSCGKSSGYGMSSRTVDAAPEVAVREIYRGAPVIRSSSDPDSKHVTFLMLSANAYLMDGDTKVEGKDVPELYLEHTVAWFAEPGTELPVAISKVTGATFRGWAFYNEDNENVWPDYYTTVQMKDELQLKAIFDGTNAGGNSSSGATGEDTGGGSIPSTGETGFGVKLNGETIKIGEHQGYNMDGYDEWVVFGVSLSEGDKFVLYDASTEATWTVANINPYSFGDEGGTGAKIAEYISVNEQEYTMKKSCKLDIYIQLMYGQDRMYFGLSA